MLNNPKGLSNWRLWKKTFTKMDPSVELVSDDTVEHILGEMWQMSSKYSTIITMIAILENLSNEHLNNAAYWAFDLMSDRIDDGRMKITDVTVKNWLCHVSPSIREVMLDELLKLQVKAEPVDPCVNITDQKTPTLGKGSYVSEGSIKSEIVAHVY